MAAELGQLLLQESRAVGAAEAVDCASKGWVRPGRRPGVRVSQELQGHRHSEQAALGSKKETLALPPAPCVTLGR